MPDTESRMTTASGGELVVQSLLRHGIERFFCVPGESYLAVIDALYDVRERITQITCRHESGAAMMALAEAELAQRPSICFVTRGPGATNASIAMHMAQQASVPLILGIGQVASNLLGHESFQEMDYTRFYGDVCKSVTNITAVEDIPQALNNAFALAIEGRPGPVAVVFPEDLLKRRGQGECCKVEATARGVAPQSLQQTFDRLAKADKPLFIAGGPLWPDASAKHLTEIAQSLRIPVVTAFRRNDVVDNTADCYAGYLGLNQYADVKNIVAEADCVVVLGARLDEPTTNAYCLPTFYHPDSNAEWIHIYPDFEALNSVPGATVRIETSPTQWLMAAVAFIKQQAPHPTPAHETWYQNCRNKFLDSLRDPFSQKYDPSMLDLPRLMTELNALLSDDAIVTTDAGNFTLWPQRLRLYRRPGRLLAPINGAMGYGVPSGIAASLVHPDRTVVTFVGDGGFMMTGMELSTAIKYGAKPIIIVFNNALFGTIDSHQRRDYPGRVHGNELTNPDFVEFAQAFGAAAVRVKTVEDFANAFLQAKQLGELALIELSLN